MRTSQNSSVRASLLKDLPLDRLQQAMAVQAIEENPLDSEQVAMFEMFEREDWPHEKRRAHIMARSLYCCAEASD